MCRLMTHFVKLILCIIWQRLRFDFDLVSVKIVDNKSISILINLIMETSTRDTLFLESFNTVIKESYIGQYLKGYIEQLF